MHAHSTPTLTMFQVNFFGAGDSAPRIIVADLPGYGYSRTSKKERAALHDLISAYCASQDRGQVLRRVMVLVDCRQGLSDVDREFMQMMETAEVDYQVVLTKCDSVRRRRHCVMHRLTCTRRSKPRSSTMSSFAHSRNLVCQRSMFAADPHPSFWNHPHTLAPQHCYPLLSVVSGRTGAGIDQLRQRVVQATIG